MNRITLNNNIQMPMLGFGTFLMGGSECEKKRSGCHPKRLPHD